MERIQEKYIRKDLESKIVFIVGPRQVGKTWLAKKIAKDYKNSVYLNYDRREDREIMMEEGWLSSTELLVLDELHKMPVWKNYLKGIFDTKNENLKIIVTGSARLDTFRQGGDSLAGRFFMHRLLPISYKEASNTGRDRDIEYFLKRGGFPEPFLTEDVEDADRWRRQYVDGLIRTDILDFEQIHDFRAVQLVLDILRERVGSPISYSSIARDVGISPTTVKKYIQIFEALYIVFRVTPFAKNIARSLLKEPKIYFFDTGLVRGDVGAKFENFVAVSYLKHVYALQDVKGEEVNLHYLRTKEGREVDFCIVKENEAIQLIEAKNHDPNLSKNLLYFHEKYGIPAAQVVINPKRERRFGEIEILRAERLLGGLSV